MKIRSLLLWLCGGLVLVVVNGLVYQSEHLLANGRVVFLALAPVDPRSLMQGDYMRLRYAITSRLPDSGAGFIVVQLNERQVASYARVYDPAMPLAANEVRLGYRNRDFEALVGPESFFFQEGDAHYYTQAKYAELRVSATGEVVLVGLCGPNLELLGPP